MRPVWRLLRRTARLVAIAFLVLVLFVAALRWVPVPPTPYMISERIRLGALDRDWTPLERVSPDLARSVVAAEDANFCAHFGFDFEAIREVISKRQARGASTISQQVAKNVFLWQGRSWVRKGLEAGFTVMIEVLWPKRRIVEVYLNVAEMGEGTFGAEAAAERWFGRAAADVSADQAARLAAILPDPKARDPRGDAVAARARAVRSGADTILADGRAACFER